MKTKKMTDFLIKEKTIIISKRYESIWSRKKKQQQKQPYSNLIYFIYFPKKEFKEEI